MQRRVTRLAVLFITHRMSFQITNNHTKNAIKANTPGISSSARSLSRVPGVTRHDSVLSLGYILRLYFQPLHQLYYISVEILITDVEHRWTRWVRTKALALLFLWATLKTWVLSLMFETPDISSPVKIQCGSASNNRVLLWHPSNM